ncbi:minor capsid protein [Akkermansia muciniphila]|uniref:minor capsid protein n=1 Tax=Akkermansia muciniphila TaxID=239935 RepID=UPI0013869884
MDDAELVARDIAKAYEQSMAYLVGETEKVMRSFQRLTGVSEAEAKRLLRGAKGKKAIDQINSMAENVADPKARQQLHDNIAAYGARAKRLDDLAKDIDAKCEEIYKAENMASTKHYTKLADEAYLHSVYDLQVGTGLGFSFSMMPKSKIDEMLRNPWSGEHYSTRIWGNTQQLAEVLKEELLTGFMTGRAYDKTALNIAQKMGAGASEARRLVRTDSCYIANRAEQESYRECGIDTYIYVATLDRRTSKICRKLDGKRFPVAEGEPGKNMPPMHPWCRSTTIAGITDEVLAGLKRSARDPETGQTYTVPANMTYEQWGQYVQENNRLLSDTGKKLTRKVKSVIAGEKVGGYTDLPAKYREAFERGLSRAEPIAGNVLKNEVKETDFYLSKKERSLYMPLINAVEINPESAPSTLAHEMFHKLDFKYNVTKNSSFDLLLRSDYGDLIKRAGNDVVSYLNEVYPEAFALSKRGTLRMRPEYRGISDIFSGLTENQLKLGYGHSVKYWRGAKNRLEMEAWAQFGRVLYENDPNVKKMFLGLFPGFEKGAMIALKELK